MRKQLQYTVMVLLISGAFSVQIFAKSVDVAEAETRLHDGKTRILDVRTVEEYSSGHLEGAQVIPVQELEKRTAELPTDKAAPILVYCGTGKRSTRAEELLEKKGYTAVLNMTGGLAAWRAQGKPVTK